MLETPHFHTSSTRPRLLVTTCVTWQPCKVEHTRNCNIVVTFEETVWFSCYSLVYLPQGPTYVGGAGDEITVPATERCATEFRLSELAQETVHYLVKRSDTPSPFRVSSLKQRLRRHAAGPTILCSPTALHSAFLNRFY